MNFLKNNQKFLTYPKVVSLTEREWISYNVVKENKKEYILENGVHVSKASGRELCPNSCDRWAVNLGRYHNEDTSCLELE